MNRNVKGFTLVEILIVVIILGILAAIVIPQFTEASNDARTSALVSDLQTLRSQIELFKVQHLEVLPGMSSGTWSETDFMNQMVLKSDASGATGTDPNTYPLGPYLQKFPSNAFVTGSTTNTVVGGTATPTGSGGGWYFNYQNGKMWANDADPNQQAM